VDESEGSRHHRPVRASQGTGWRRGRRPRSVLPAGRTERGPTATLLRAENDPVRRGSRDRRQGPQSDRPSEHCAMTGVPHVLQNGPGRIPVGLPKGGFLYGDWCYQPGAGKVVALGAICRPSQSGASRSRRRARAATTQPELVSATGQDRAGGSRCRGDRTRVHRFSVATRWSCRRQKSEEESMPYYRHAAAALSRKPRRAGGSGRALPLTRTCPLRGSSRVCEAEPSASSDDAIDGASLTKD